MPHSGGRVGKGIYLALENSKSADYGKSSKLPKCGLLKPTLFTSSRDVVVLFSWSHI